MLKARNADQIIGNVLMKLRRLTVDELVEQMNTRTIRIEPEEHAWFSTMVNYLGKQKPLELYSTLDAADTTYIESMQDRIGDEGFVEYRIHFDEVSNNGPKIATCELKDGRRMVFYDIVTAARVSTTLVIHAS